GLIPAALADRATAVRDQLAGGGDEPGGELRGFGTCVICRLRLSGDAGAMIVNESRYDIGMRVRREVLGDAHVDRALAQQTDFDATFHRYVTEVPWGTLWSRPDLD